MTQSWKAIRRKAVEDGRLDEKRVAEYEREQQAELRAHKLAELRKRMGLNQKEVAEAMHVSQARVSKIERGQLGKSQVDTLRAYAQAIGVELEITIRVGDDQFAIG